MGKKLPKLPGIDVEKELEQYRNDIQYCLMKYGQLDEETAKQKMEGAYFFKRLNDSVALANLFHEEPYYWAMTLIQTDSNWYKDPKLWPPPRDCYD